jgi:nucleotide-binding universal stress UspA family protein
MSKAALREADDLARGRGATLTLAFVYPVTSVRVLDYTYSEPPERVAETLEVVEARLRTVANDLHTPPDHVNVLVLTGEPANSLVAASTAHDLVVMSTHGRTGVSRFMLGSVTERVVRGAACSVLVIRTPGDAVVGTPTP